MSHKQLLLLLLYSAGVKDKGNEPVKGRTRLMKMVFLFDKEVRNEFLKNTNFDGVETPDFEPWHYGPFSKQVLDDVEFFLNNGYLDVTCDDLEQLPEEHEELVQWLSDYLFQDEIEAVTNSVREESFSLTVRGTAYVEAKLWRFLTDNQKRILRKFKQSINSADLRAILRYTYLKYPEYTEKSKIRDDVIGYLGNG